MSMLSAQVDELRAMAESVGLEVPQAATLMEDAADTINELRGALQVASTDYRYLQAERDNLRDERREYQATIDSLVDECADHMAENAKLRELVRELLPCYQWSDCYDGCMAADGPLCPHPAKLTERARELGVEVDG